MNLRALAMDDDDALVRERLLRLLAASRPEYVERLMVKADGRTQFVRVADIDRIESAGNYARLHVGRSSHLIRETLCALEARLDPTRFGRIHRRVIVNLSRVREIQPWFGGDQIVILTDGLRLRLSRSYREAFVARLSRAP